MKTLEHVRAALPPYPIEVQFPDISRWKNGNQGIDYVHSFDSGVPGPHVLLMALTHGNEVSGAITVDKMLTLGVRPSRGRLSFAFANVAAYEQIDPSNIDATRFIDEDMNRVWEPEKLNGPDDSIEVRRARELRPLLNDVDFLLDLHSMHEGAAPLMMAGPRAKSLRLAAQIGAPGTIIVDEGHANGRRMRDYGAFNDPASSRIALLIETGQHVSKRSEQVAMDVAARFLLTLQVVSKEHLASFLSPVATHYQQFLQVTDAVVANSMDFTFTEDFRGLEVIERAGTPIARDGDRVVVTPYDNCVLIQPSLRQLGVGVTVVRLARVLLDPSFTEFQ